MRLLDKKKKEEKIEILKGILKDKRIESETPVINMVILRQIRFNNINDLSLFCMKTKAHC